MATARRKVCGQYILVAHRAPGDGDGACKYPRMHGKQKCVWHWLAKQPAAKQREYAIKRMQAWTGSRRDRVSKDEWPPGERWCSGCQSFVPLFYVSGSRCRSCESSASHEASVQKTYGLEPGDYDRLLELQGGRCYICGRQSPSRRLAVDHDHVTGVARGLLCPDPERGCNHKVLGPLEANSVDGGLAAARRMVDYLEDPPYERMRRGEKLPEAPRSGPTPLVEVLRGYMDPPPF